MRKVKLETQTVEKLVAIGEEVSCDLCGWNEDADYIFEIQVEIDADACVGTRITRDVCQWCYDTKLAAPFDKLFEELEAGNEKHEWRIEDEGDRWYG